MSRRYETKGASEVELGALTGEAMADELGIDPRPGFALILGDPYATAFAVVGEKPALVAFAQRLVRFAESLPDTPAAEAYTPVAVSDYVTSGDPATALDPP